MYDFQDVVSIGKSVWINGIKLPPVPGNKRRRYNQTVIGQKIYINGYEWVGTKWKRTLKALWYKFI